MGQNSARTTSEFGIETYKERWSPVHCNLSASYRMNYIINFADLFCYTAHGRKEVGGWEVRDKDSSTRPVY